MNCHLSTFSKVNSGRCTIYDRWNMRIFGSGLCVLLLLGIAKANKPRLGLCVTGQLSRLELWSKIFNVIVPNAPSYAIDVLFVLDAEQHSAVNSEAALNGMPVALLDKATIQSHMTRYCPECHVMFDFAPQPKSPPAMEPYVHDMGKYKPYEIDSRRKRAILNARNMHTWTRCYQNFYDRSLQTGLQYDLYMRVRDDSFAFWPFHISLPMWNNTISILRSCGWGGVNDKQAILDKRFAYLYFVKPLQNFYMSYEELTSHLPITNPEKILRGSLDHDNVKVRLVPNEEMPFGVVRYRLDGSICVADMES